MQAEQILFATDYSESSAHALSVAVLLSRESDGLLLIAHVSDAEQYPVGELFDEEPKPDSAELNRLKSIVPSDFRVRHEHRLLYGEPGSAAITKPADVIVKFADRERVDVIVLGTHGRSGLSRVVMGSVAETVVRNAPCAVVVVKPPTFIDPCVVNEHVRELV